MLNIENITINYKKHTVLTNCSFSVSPGECVGLLGLNGSGKSSLLRCIAGIQKSTSGHISYDNKLVTEDLKSYQNNLGFVTQDNPLCDELSAMDNLRLFTSMTKTEIMSFLNQPEIKLLAVTDFIDKPVKNLSGGMKKRLSIASILMNNPKILLLDEPFAALDMIAKEDITRYIQTFRSRGGAVIVASHDESLFRICNKVYVLRNSDFIDARTLPQNRPFSDFLRS